MRGLCGWFMERGAPSPAESIRQVIASSGRATPRLDTRTKPMAELAVFGDMARPALMEEGDFIVAAAGHPRLRGAGHSSGDPLALLRALRDRGRDALRDVEGDFAIATWNAATDQGMLAIDRIGIHRLFYARLPRSLAFATTLDLLTACPGVDRTVSRQALFDYVFQHVTPGPQTVFERLARLPAGHCIEFTASGAGAPTPYWSMRFDEGDHRNFDELKAQFLGLLESAVQDAAAGGKAGAFLSGGTDSSTVSGMLARFGGAPAETFSIGFDAAGYDEMEYARIAAKHFNCAHHEYYVTPQDVVAAVPAIAASYDQPFGNASAIPTYYCAKVAREHGIERLLAGDGGDELFGGNERYAKHHLLGLYQRVPQAMRRQVVEPLLVSAPGLERVPLIRKLRSYVLQARPPMPQRYASSNQLTHLGAQAVFTPDFLAGIDTDHPNRLLDDAFAPYAEASLINQMLGIDLRFILEDGDLPKVTHMCELAGVDVAFPMLDDRLVEFSRHLPAELKLRGTTLRWFFKKALSDFLPPAIITKQKHGFGLPVGTWLVGHRPLFDLAAQGIASLSKRGIVQRRFADDLLDSRLREHAAYFGGMAWVLMMLGLWLDSHRL